MTIAFTNVVDDENNPNNVMGTTASNDNNTKTCTYETSKEEDEGANDDCEKVKRAVLSLCAIVDCEGSMDHELATFNIFVRSSV